MALTYDELYGIQNQYNKKVTESTKKTTKSSSSPSSSKQYTQKLIENNIAPYKVVSRNVNNGFIAPITKAKPTVTTSTKKKKEDDRTWFKKSSYFDDGYDFGDITRTVVSKSLSAIKNNFSDGYDFGDVTKTILGVSSAPKVKSTVSSFDSSLMNKYSSMNLSQIENEYKRVTAELDSFKKANGGKFYNFIAKTGASVGVASDQTGTALSELGKADANISKINDLTREKEIISLYRKQIAIKEKLGELSDEQLQLLDNIAKAESIDDAAPFFYMSADAKYSDPSSYYKMTDSERQLGESSKKKLFEQLKGENPGKSDEELNELIDELVELRSNQRNAEQQASASAQIGELATEHPVAAFLLSRGADLAGGMVALPELFYQRGNEYGLDINAPGFSFVNASAKIDEQIQLDHDWKIGGVDAFDLFYEAGTGIVDNVARLAFSGGNTTAAGAVMFSQVATQSIVEGKKKGYSDSKALASGLLVGTFEAVSEKLSLDAVLGSKGGVLKRLAKAFAAEGGEEVTSNWLNRIADVVANGNHSELSRKYEAYREMGYSDSKALAETVLDAIGEDAKAFVVGGIAGTVMGGGNIALNAVSNVMQKNEPVRLDDKSQTVVDKAVEALVEQEKQKGNKVTKSTEKNIRKAVINNLNKGYLDKDSIYREFGGEEYENYKKVKELSESNISSGKQVIKNLENAKKKLQKEYDALYKMKNGDKSDEQIDRQNQIKEQIANIDAEIEKTTGVIDKLSNDKKLSDLEAKLDANVYELVKDSKLAETFREGDRRGERFFADTGQYKNEYAKKTVQNALDYGVNTEYGFNNTNAAHDFVDFAVKIASDKKVEIVFTNTEGLTKLKEGDNEYNITADPNKINAFISEEHNKMFINMDTNKSLQSLVGHEITHTTEKAKSYDSVADLVKSTLGEEEFSKLVEKKTETYKNLNLSKEDIEKEVVADFIGDKLFTDYDFIKRLSVEHRNIFQQIWDEIKYLCNVATAGSKEARELEKLKHQFEKAYKESAKEQKNTADDGSVKYMLSKDVDGNTFVDVTEDILDVNDGKSVAQVIRKVISERFNNLISVNGQNIQINKTTNDEFRRSESAVHFINNPSQTYTDKLKTIANADEILYAAKNWIGEELKHERKDDIVEFARANVMYRVGENGYVADVLVGIRKNGAAVLYDLVNIYDKEITEASVTMASDKIDSQRRQNASVDDILPHNSEKSSGNHYSLSAEQESYFKDSKVRDENGNLKVMYHGSHESFTVFDKKKARSSGTYGKGFYFTDSKSHAATYGNSYDVYLNITNPIQDGTNDITKEQLRKFVEVIAKDEDYGIENYGYGATVDSVTDSVYGKSDFGMLLDLNVSCIGNMVEAVELFNEVNGTDYDGIVAPTETVAFYPNQIKKVDNTTPSTDPDIRYSLSEDIDNVEKILYDKNNSLSIVNRAKTNNNSSLKWVYDSEIFSVEESKLFHEKISEINQGSEAFSKNSADEYMIPIENKIIFTDGNYDSPYVREIVEVLTDNQTDFDDIRECIYSVEKGESEKQDAARYVQNTFGKGCIVSYKSGNNGVYGWENGKRKGKSRSSVIRNHLNKQLRRRNDRKSKETQINEIAPINEASSKDGVFFDGEKTNDPDVNLSLSDEGETSKQYGNFNTYAKDITLQRDIAPRNVSASSATDDIAPVQESVAQNEGIVNEADFAPIKAQQGVEATPISGVQKEATPTESNDVEEKPTRRSELHQNIVDRLKGKFKEKGFDFDEVLKQAKNLSTFATVDNIPQRVMEKALGYKQGQILADETVNKVAQNESEGIKWLNSFTDRKNGLLAQISKQYNIKPGSKKSAAAQMYAEGFYVNKNNEIVEYGDKELAIDFPDLKVQESIKGLVNDPRIRQIYDETLNAINESRSRNLYPEIPRLDNYFLHFRAMEDTFSRLGLPFNPDDISAKDLPTELNGMTADLKPGQPYFASAMHREGLRTSFDLLGGLERYLSSAKNQIYHIDDIQTLRALRNYIADTYGQAKGLESLDNLSEEDVQERIKQVYGSHLSTFAKFLNEEANVLAGKTTLIDRGLEGIIGRRGITFLNTINGQVGSNMVGWNISSSLTNFLPVAQTLAKGSKVDFTKAFVQTVSSKIGSIFGKTDSFVENNPTIIRRKGAERFYRTPFQKIGDTGYALMSAVDDISTELIVRTKYNELVRKGMSEQKASFEADKWVSRLMGDRSLGQQPQLYNSKMLGLITKFQLEVRNQLDSQFYDTIQEAKVSNEEIESKLLRNAKTAAKVTSTFVQLAAVQHLYGTVFESIAGYNPAFDIVDVLIKALGFDDDEEDEDTVLDNIEEGFFALLEDLPYTSTFTGGRIPISSALPISEFIKGEDQYGNEKSRWDTIKEVAPYYLLPTGYGQIKKTTKGLEMFSDENPVTGSYTDSGNLRFPIDDTLKNRIQAGVFGQYASENARTYFDEGYAPLKEKQIQEYRESDMPIADYWKYREGLKDFKSQDDKVAYINGLDISKKQKDVLKSYLYDEEGYKKENPEKYAFLEREGIGFLGYKELDEDTQSAWSWAFKHQDEYEYYKQNGVLPGDYSTYYIPMLDFENEDNDAYSWAYDNPEKATFSKAITDNVVDYRKITKELYAIEADKDENGNSISGTAKPKKQEYIWSLDIDEAQKYILFKNEYNSYDDHNREIVDYIISRDDLSYDERKTILETIGFTIDEDGTIRD